MFNDTTTFLCTLCEAITNKKVLETVQKCQIPTNLSEPVDLLQFKQQYFEKEAWCQSDCLDPLWAEASQAVESCSEPMPVRLQRSTVSRCQSGCQDPQWADELNSQLCSDRINQHLEIDDCRRLVADNPLWFVFRRNDVPELPERWQPHQPGYDISCRHCLAAPVYPQTDGRRVTPSVVARLKTWFCTMKSQPDCFSVVLKWKFRTKYNEKIANQQLQINKINNTLKMDSKITSQGNNFIKIDGYIINKKTAAEPSYEVWRITECAESWIHKNLSLRVANFKISVSGSYCAVPPERLYAPYFGINPLQMKTIFCKKLDVSTLGQENYPSSVEAWRSWNCGLARRGDFSPSHDTVRTAICWKISGFYHHCRVIFIIIRSDLNQWFSFLVSS